MRLEEIEQQVLIEFHAHFPIHADKGINNKEFLNYEQVINSSKDRKQRVVKVLTGHCGVGKTRRLFQEWQKQTDKKKMYMSHSHLFLGEQSKRVKGSRHIQGLGRVCPYRNKNNETGYKIKNLISLGLPNKIICGFCKKNEYKCSKDNKCSYKKQFKKYPKTIMLPIEYGFTHVLESYKPNIIAVDDCLLRKKNHKTLEELESFLRIANLWGETYQESQNMNSEYFIPEDLLLSTNFINFNIKNSIIELLQSETFQTDIEQYQAIWEYTMNALIELYGDNFIIPYSNFNFYGVESYKKYADIYGMLKQFATANLFPIFDYMFKYTDMDAEIDDVPHVILIEAMPNEKFLQDIVDMYFKETGNIIHLDFEYIKPEIIPDSTFYRCATYEGNWYPSTRSIVESESTRAKIKEHIQQILDAYYNGGDSCKIGLMFPKKCKLEDFIDTTRYKDVLNLRFGNQRGKNELEYCNPYFVIGTYLINKNEIENDYFLWFKEYPESSDSYQEEKKKSRFRFVDSKLDNFRSMFEEEEQYHAVFRSRSLTYKRQVFCFGIIPEEMEKIFGADKIINLTFGRKVKYEDNERIEFIYDIVEKHKGIIPEKEVRKIMMNTYNIKDNTARRIIKEIVEESDYIDFGLIKIGRNKPKHIVKRGIIKHNDY